MKYRAPKPEPDPGFYIGPHPPKNPVVGDLWLEQANEIHVYDGAHWMRRL